MAVGSRVELLRRLGCEPHRSEPEECGAGHEGNRVLAGIGRYVVGDVPRVSVCVCSLISISASSRGKVDDSEHNDDDADDVENVPHSLSSGWLDPLGGRDG